MTWGVVQNATAFQYVRFHLSDGTKYAKDEAAETTADVFRTYEHHAKDGELKYKKLGSSLKDMNDVLDEFSCTGSSLSFNCRSPKKKNLLNRSVQLTISGKVNDPTLN